MATYVVKEVSFINNRLVQPGETVEYDGEPGKALELVETADGDKARTVRAKTDKAGRSDKASDLV